MGRWTRVVIANRKKVLLVWALLVVLGLAGAANLGGLLTNRFSVPGSQAEDGLNVAKARFGEHGDGDFTLVARAASPAVAASPRFAASVRAAAERASASLKGGKAGPVLPAARGVAYVQITTPLVNADASKKTPDLRRAIGTVPGVRTYLTGFPAINHDTQKIYNQDLARGEMIAGTIALLVLVFMFGTLA